MTNRVVFRTVGLFTCIESCRRTHDTRRAGGGGSRVRSFATFLGQPLTWRGGRSRGRNSDRDGGFRGGGARHRKKASVFVFLALRRDRSPRASRRVGRAGGGEEARRPAFATRPRGASRATPSGARASPEAASRRDEAAEVQSRGRGTRRPARATSARAGVGRARGRTRTREALQAQREVLEAHIGGGRGVRARAVGPETSLGRASSPARTNAFSRKRRRRTSAARASLCAPQSHRAHAPGSRRASNVHTGDVMTRGRREGRARDSAGRPLVVVWRSFLNRTGRDTREF